MINNSKQVIHLYGLGDDLNQIICLRQRSLLREVPRLRDEIRHCTMLNVRVDAFS